MGELEAESPPHLAVLKGQMGELTRKPAPPLVGAGEAVSKMGLSRGALERNRSRDKNSRQIKKPGASSDRKSLSTVAEFALDDNHRRGQRPQAR